MVYQVAAAVRIPVIGIGGIMSLGDALEFFLAGATAVQIGTGIFVDPGLPIRLIDELEAWLDARVSPRSSKLSASPIRASGRAKIESWYAEAAEA